jgi:hypothetical protein
VFAVSFVDWAAQGERGLQLADGTALPIGASVYLVGLQTGRTEADVVTDFGTSIATVFSADLKIYATTTVGLNTLTAGTFAAPTASSSDASFDGLQIYYVAIETALPTTAQQIGMWKIDSAAWKFPGVTAAPPSNQTATDLNDANSSVLGSLVSAGQNDWGYSTAGQLALIPEPSTILLVGFGLLGAVGLARRRS